MGSVFSETSLSSAIQMSAYKERRDRFDRICKRVLSEKIILGWIMHECLEEYRDVSPDDIAEHLIEGKPTLGGLAVHPDHPYSERIVGINSEDSTVSEGTVWFDIRFEALLPNTDDAVGVIVNVEAQGEFYPGYPLLKRAMYYCSRMISSQYGRTFTDSHYEDLQKVFSIWICTNPPRAFRNTVTRYSVSETNVVGAASARASEYDLLEMLLVCPDGDRQQAGDGILRLLGTLVGSDQSAEARKAVLSSEFGISMSRELAKEVDEMSSLSKGILDRGIEEGHRRGFDQGYQQGRDEGLQEGLKEGRDEGLQEGRKQGHDEGLQEGRRQGHDEGLQEGRRQGHDEGLQEGLRLGRDEGLQEGVEAGMLASIRSLTQTVGMTPEQAMDALQIPGQEREHYLTLL